MVKQRPNSHGTFIDKSVIDQFYQQYIDGNLYIPSDHNDRAFIQQLLT